VNINISKITIKRAVWAVLLMSVLYSFCMDFFKLHGWTKTVLIDFQNERILIYFMIFLLGSLFYKHKTFESEWSSTKLDLILHCTGWIPINLYIFLLIYSLVKPGEYLISEVADILMFRLNYVLALGYLLYVMMTTFRKYFKKQGRIRKELNNNSYYVYIIHVIVMGTIALAMHDAAIASILKPLILAVLTFAVSNLIVSICRKVIQLIFSLNQMKCNNAFNSYANRSIPA
jgi:hypothetical protein